MLWQYRELGKHTIWTKLMRHGCMILHSCMAGEKTAGLAHLLRRRRADLATKYAGTQQQSAGFAYIRCTPPPTGSAALLAVAAYASDAATALHYSRNDDDDDAAARSFSFRAQTLGNMSGAQTTPLIGALCVLSSLHSLHTLGQGPLATMIACVDCVVLCVCS